MSKRLARTDQIEMVETHNLAISLKRCTDGPYDTDKWKRAFYHALAMSGVSNRGEIERIRIALQLP